ncbi:MAG: hypothetical protein IJ635_06415 [Bacteroidaceae bacterium]|nr:hypothetical protein [Bacteroidaceae bacterium]
MKNYDMEIDDNATMVVGEPAVAYPRWESSEMPCVFAEDELKEEIRLSEESGNASEKEVRTFFSSCNTMLNGGL